MFENEINSEDATALGVYNFLARHRSVLFFGSTVVFFVLAALLALTQHNRQDNYSNTVAKNTTESLTDSKGKIYVYVAGAVKNPGVYAIPVGSRLEQAITTAGGFDDETVDKDFVARELNLAAKLTDGQKVYVLHRNEVKTGIVTQGVGTGVASSGSGIVNINSASEKELEALPGIGAVSAQKIIDQRPYASIDDLLNKKAISRSLFMKIKDLISA